MGGSRGDGRHADPEDVGSDAQLGDVWRWLYARLVRRGVPAELAADITQESVLWVWRSRERLCGTGRVRGAAATVARRLLRDHERSAEARLVELRSDIAEDAAGLAPDTADVAAQAAHVRQLAAAIERLSADEQHLLRAAGEGVTWLVLARQLGISFPAVRVRLHRARAKARLELLREQRRRDGVLAWGWLLLRRRPVRSLRPSWEPSHAAIGIAVLGTFAVSALVTPGRGPARVQQLTPRPPAAAALPGTPVRRPAPPATAASVGQPRPYRGPRRVASRPPERTPSPAATCLAGVCVTDRPDGDHYAPGDYLCASHPEVDRCAGQDWYPMCENTWALPREAATCHRQGDPDWRIEPSPSPSP